eukprot:scpid50791/ scgid3516/ Ras-related protein Rab-22A; Rab-14
MAREVKLCLLGDTGVGKTCLVLRFVTNTFNENSECTVGASFMTKSMVVDNKTIKFHIWDTAGQERYRGLAPMYYRGAAAAILVYDITNKVRRSLQLSTVLLWKLLRRAWLNWHMLVSLFISTQ